VSWSDRPGRSGSRLTHVSSIASGRRRRITASARRHRVLTAIPAYR
jgi:hypothetical protein